jgi:hypothetical protein
MALEGHPKKRFELLPEYKANRQIEPNTPKHDALVDFHRQKSLILELIERHFPISLVRHPDYEADDTINNIVRRSSTTAEFVIVTSDTDFLQLVGLPNVKVYNPVKKEFHEWNGDDDYVVYKALKGDPTDNIPGIPGFGEVKAMKYAKNGVANPARMIKELADLAFSLGDSATNDIARNLELVRFALWNDEDREGMTCSAPRRDWDAVKARFDAWEFASITKDKTWQKFVKTFDGLFGSEDDVTT